MELGALKRENKELKTLQEAEIKRINEVCCLPLTRVYPSSLAFSTAALSKIEIERTIKRGRNSTR